MVFRIGKTALGAALGFGLAICPAYAAPPKPSSETSAARICFDFDRSLDELLHWCRQALTEVGVARADLERAHNNLGWLYSDRGDFDAAKASYNDALSLNPLNASSHSGLGWVYWDIEDYEAARASFARAVELNAGVSSLAGLASSLRYLETDLDRAQSLLEQAILIDPEYSWAARELGWLHTDIDNYEEAHVYFDKAISIYPEDGWAYYGKSTVAYDQDDFDGAATLVNTALGYQENRVFLSMRALIMNAQEKYRQAISDASRALVLSPEYGFAARQKARAHRALGHEDLALQTFADADAAGATGAYFYSDYADLLYDQNLAADALPMITASLAQDDKDAWAHNLHGLILFDLARFADAVAAAERALSVRRDYAYPHISIAYSRVALGEFDAALEAARQAQALDIGAKSVNDFIRFVIAEGHLLTAIKYRAALETQP